MKHQANVVIHKGCHSRMSLSGIYNARCCQIKDDSLLNKYVEDPQVLRTAKSGMTPNLAGFTLIELLVVVLIIGILVAVAVPQYQKAVWKSRSAHLRTLQKAVAIAQNVYYEANGTYPTQFSQLDLSFDNLTPANQSTLGATTQIKNTDFVRYNDLFEVFLDPTGSTTWFREGKYKGCGWYLYFKTGEWRCMEWYIWYKGTPGSFCQQVMGAGPLIVNEQSVRKYTLEH